MRLAWTAEAADDLEAIVEYIRLDNEDASLRVANRIVDRLTALSHSPMSGRAGLAPGTREVLLTPYPYLAIYRVTPTQMRVLRIVHAARERK